jgi:glucose-6-phosphate 1-epimerase
LSEHELSTDIHVSNPSTSDALDFQALLHTYIRAPANDVSISPLLGKRYIDKTEKSLDARNALKEETRSAVDVRSFTDSVYEDAPPKTNVTWPGGAVELKLHGFTTLTVWNPQAEAGSKIGDMEENGWYVLLLLFCWLVYLFITPLAGNDLYASNLGTYGGSSDWILGGNGSGSRYL